MLDPKQLKNAMNYPNVGRVKGKDGVELSGEEEAAEEDEKLRGSAGEEEDVLVLSPGRRGRGKKKPGEGGSEEEEEEDELTRAAKRQNLFGEGGAMPGEEPESMYSHATSEIVDAAKVSFKHVPGL